MKLSMRILLSLTALLLLIQATPVWAVNTLLDQGDSAMSSANFQAAEAIYKRALTKEKGDRQLIERLERAALLRTTNDFLSMLDREVQKKGDIRISAKQVATLMSAGEPLTMIDIRTPQEQAFVVPRHALFIQLPEIARHLDQIPTEGTVVIVCHSSPRAMIAATALRIIGFDNVYALKGGIMSIADINAKKSPDNL